MVTYGSEKNCTTFFSSEFLKYVHGPFTQLGVNFSADHGITESDMTEQLN